MKQVRIFTMNLTFFIRLFHKIRGMRNSFALSIKNNLSIYRDTEMRSRDCRMYVFDEKFKNEIGEDDGRTYLTSDDTNTDRSLIIENNSKKEIVHFCIDGGIIRFGRKCPDYVGDGKPHSRPDCMLFSDDKLIFVELKMNMQTEEDKGVYKNYRRAVDQLQDFLCNYFIPQYASHNDKIDNYYSKGSYYSVICMKTTPRLAGHRNTELQNKKEAFRIATNMDVVVKAIESF